MCLAIVASGCGPEPQEAETEPAPAVSTEVSATETARRDLRLEQHMQHMAAVPPDSLMYMMPMHLEEVGAVLDELEPMSHGMQSDTVWRSTVDSVQNDLALMRDMSPEGLRAFMPEHTRRVERLISLHDSAMGTER